MGVLLAIIVVICSLRSQGWALVDALALEDRGLLPALAGMDPAST
ncbi:hypothetical protein ACIQD1_31170 [Streptomyces sp. NPDC093088]